MMENNYINVDIYGAATRKAPARAEYLYCENYEQCSLYKEKKCFGKTTIFGKRCPFADISSVNLGCTPRSAKYIEGKNKVYADPKHSILSYPTNDIYVYTCGNNVFLNIPHVTIKKDSEQNLIVDRDPISLFGISSIVQTTEDKITNKVLYEICSAIPRTFFENRPIKNYQAEYIPNFLIQLKKNLPNIYNRFVKEYPEYNKSFKDINFVGRKAYLSTCCPDPKITYTDSNGNEFHFMNENEIYCSSYKTAFLPFNSKESTLKMKVTDDMTVKITDNNQVLETTRFC